MLKSHTLVATPDFSHIRYELRPALGPDGSPAEGLHNAWIVLDNPRQHNSYTTEAVAEVILAFRAASMDRSVVACVLTAVGDQAFCTGGNTAEYAEYYAGNPQEYRGYMRLFNDMVTSILTCDKPVVCRVNGMRIGGGQEIGMHATSHWPRTSRASARPAPSTALPQSAASPISCRSRLTSSVRSRPASCASRSRPTRRTTWG